MYRETFQVLSSVVIRQFSRRARERALAGSPFSRNFSLHVSITRSTAGALLQLIIHFATGDQRFRYLTQIRPDVDIVNQPGERRGNKLRVYLQGGTEDTGRRRFDWYFTPTISQCFVQPSDTGTDTSSPSSPAPLTATTGTPPCPVGGNSGSSALYGPVHPSAGDSSGVVRSATPTKRTLNRSQSISVDFSKVPT